MRTGISTYGVCQVDRKFLSAGFAAENNFVHAGMDVLDGQTDMLLVIVYIRKFRGLLQRWKAEGSFSAVPQ